MRVLLLLVLLAGCKNTVPVEVRAIVPGGDVVRGTVQSVDAQPMTYDADGLVVVQTEAGTAVTIHVPARMHLCEAEGLDVFHDLRPGDRVEVRGDWDEPGHLRPCTSPEHYLCRAG